MNKNKIVEHFGKDFYEKVLVDTEKYAVLWFLSDLKQIAYYSVNCLFTCVSAKHGASILKISPNPRETNAEYHALKDFNDNSNNGLNLMCKPYEADVDNGVLLIERIMPGIQLRDESGLNTRLDVFCGLFRGLHRPPADKSKYPTYMDWVSRIAAYMRSRADSCADFTKLSEKMTKAEEICRHLWEKYPANMLLHGDLHHDNILLGGDGYRVIDPKGVVGNAVFDIPRFILNEDDLDKGNNYAQISRIIAEKLGVSERDIALLFYVETCMANSWNVESGNEIDWDDVLFAERVAVT